MPIIIDTEALVICTDQQLYSGSQLPTPPKRSSRSGNVESYHALPANSRDANRSEKIPSQSSSLTQVTVLAVDLLAITFAFRVCNPATKDDARPACPQVVSPWTLLLILGKFP
jgi:hypothetical protein